MTMVKCSCGAEIPSQVREIGLCKYSCSRSVKVSYDKNGGRISTVFFPHFGIYHGAEIGYGEYETFHFTPDGKVKSQEFHRDEALALLHHDTVVKYANMFSDDSRRDFKDEAAKAMELDMQGGQV